VRAFASRTHYLDHIAPLWTALGAPTPVLVDRGVIGHADGLGLPSEPVLRGRGPCVVASYRDLWRARKHGYGPFILMQHGAGQSYHGDHRSAGNPAYAGGRDHDDVALFLVPGPDPARRWAERYPKAAVVQTGLAKPLPAREPGDGPVVAFTWHWPLGLVPETRTAWPEYRDIIPVAAERWRVIGHWHPRWGVGVRRWYEAHGIEPVESLADVARRADVLVGDNTSAIYEFAATDRPVVLANASVYRKVVHHGLRFWEASAVGIQADTPDCLLGAIRLALMDPRGLRESRREAVRMVYAGDPAAGVRAVAAM
jgi:hypothetical protein